MWRIHDGYAELLADQRTPGWKEARLLLITSSLAEACLGWSSFTSQEDALAQVRGKKELSLTLAMRAGIDAEEPLKQLYKRTYPDRKLRETSLCILLRDICPQVTKKYGSMFTNVRHPNWFLGVSPDAFIDEDGALEAKYTMQLYFPLRKRMKEKKTSYITLLAPSGRQTRIPAHIFSSHYLQMQYAAGVTRKAYEDYLVGSPQGTYLERIPAVRSYWEEFLYPELIALLEEKYLPMLTPSEWEIHEKRVHVLLKAHAHAMLLKAHAHSSHNTLLKSINTKKALPLKDPT